ncbi:unknown [Feldmannia species virus]|uniref:Uncharacterized protein n=1 Tax=Feldmannia species virus TaxID=39420 RepID=B5LW93_9PHYC|nr:hypothetical protein FeldSpV_gp004 [Feldmannia species virus]ACH46756.1 unknown [Feldmannia species virus]
MDSIIVDRASGLIGVSSIMKQIVPTVSDSTMWRMVEKTLRDSAVPKRHLRKSRMLTLDEAFYLVDHVQFPLSSEWRAANADTFKENLRSHVQAKTAPLVGDGGGESVETKASVLQNCLRSVNIIGSIRVDEDTGLGSLIDIVKIVCPDMCKVYAKTTLARVLEEWPHHVADCVKRLKINGRGHVTPVADAKTIAEIIWLLPGRAAREFRRQSAEIVMRVLGGDTTLCKEIEERSVGLQSTREGRAFQNFALGGESGEKKRLGGELMEHASSEDYERFVKMKVEHEMCVMEQKFEQERAILARKFQQEQEEGKVDSELRIVASLKRGFDAVNSLSESRHKIELSDIVSDIQRRALRKSVSVETAVDPGVSVPTPDCPANIRGEEVSIAMVSGEMGVHLGGRAGTAGKKLKVLYMARYGADAANNIPKRATIFQGRPYRENTYYARDKDLVQQAIEETIA